jgi:hypothetical protein
MNRTCLALSLLAVFLAVGQAQSTSPLALYLHDTTGILPDTPLPFNYQLASTAVGGNTPTVLKMINSSSNNVYFATALVSPSVGSTAQNPNFSVNGVFVDQILVPGASVLFTVNFTPTTTGIITGYLTLAYQVQQNGCVYSGAGTVCPATLSNASIFNGTATNAVLTLSYQSSSGPVVLSPSSASPLNFPNTSLSSTSSITFTLTNATAASVPTPAISLPLLNSTQPNAFTLDRSTVPASMAPGQASDFIVTFEPSQAGLANVNLQIGAYSYPLQGYGIIVATIDALQISYTNSTGVRTLPQAATPISFGQVVPGSGASSTLTFNLLNPTTSANSVVINAITISGATYSLSGLPTIPVTLPPGASINFTAVFGPVGVGTFTGSLAIGSRSFLLTGVGISSTVPSLSITTSGNVSSQEQLNLVIQAGTPSPVATLGTLTMKFAPSIASVTDDAAVQFLATGGRQLNISLASGAETATYNNQSTIGFQTGTTAGTLTFSVAFPNTPTYSKSFTIPAATPPFTSVQASRDNPNLLITVDGFDNTYSAGPLSFTFYDTSGKVIGAPINFNAAAQFHDLFFTGNTYGGLFSLQATFPVSGDITKVGSVNISLANSAGTTTSSATFH